MKTGVRRTAIGVAALLVVALAGSIATVILLEVRRRERVTACAGNLQMLWKMQMVALTTTGRRGPLPEHPLGAGYWKTLQAAIPPLPDDVFTCPVLGKAGPGEVQYWGPSVHLSRLQGAEPVGCDAPENHRRGGGNVLLKSGDILETDGPLWDRCRTGACRP